MPPSSDPRPSPDALSPAEVAALFKELRSVRSDADRRVTSLERMHADRLDRMERLWEATVSNIGNLSHRVDLLERALLPNRVRRIEETLGFLPEEESEPIRDQRSMKGKTRKVSRGNR